MSANFDVSRIRRWSAVPLRAIVGWGFIVHGYAKVVNGPDHFAASLQALRVPVPHVMAWATIGFELLGGLAILVGAYVPLVSLPLTAILLVAALTVHLPYGFSSIKLLAVTPSGPQFGPPGYETDLLYLAALATLVLGGSGPLTLGRWRSAPGGNPGQRVVLCRDDAECQELGAFLADRIYEFNAAATGYDDGKLLAGCVRGDSGEVIAGFNGHTWGACCELSHVWVDEGHRGRGLGRLLLRSADAEAIARGCMQIVLATHSFQAPGFYERMGYERKYAIEGRPKGYADVVYVKIL